MFAPLSAVRRAEVSSEAAEKTEMFLCVWNWAGSFSGERAMPWILTSGCFFRSEVVIRRAILPVKPAMAIVRGAISSQLMLFVSVVRKAVLYSQLIVGKFAELGDG